MGKIFYIMGKSSSGKDTIYHSLHVDKKMQLSNLVLYTTRPMREGEVEGETYHFVSEKEFCCLKESGKVIEARKYQTVYGQWIYFTVADKQLEDLEKNYIGIGTLESYLQLKNYYGEERIYPIYIEVEDGERLKRAIYREEQQKNPKYEEMCRRFLADTQDFSEEKLQEAGITRRFYNEELENCVKEIKNYIQKLQ